MHYQTHGKLHSGGKKCYSKIIWGGRLVSFGILRKPGMPLPLPTTCSGDLYLIHVKYHQVVDEESNETRVERNQAKNLTFQEDGSDWIGNMLTNK